MNASFFVAFVVAPILVFALCWAAVVLHERSVRRDRHDPAE